MGLQGFTGSGLRTVGFLLSVKGLGFRGMVLDVDVSGQKLRVLSSLTEAISNSCRGLKTIRGGFGGLLIRMIVYYPPKSYSNY